MIDPKGISHGPFPDLLTAIEYAKGNWPDKQGGDREEEPDNWEVEAIGA